MLKRILYALSMAWRYRKMLSAYKCNSALQTSDILALNPLFLKEKGIKILILDFDGVLAAHGEIVLSPAIISWINSCIQVLGEGKIFVLSNKATTTRAEYFARTFKGVKWIFPTRKKPYPDGILQILQLTHTAPQEILVIDDRLLTGILAAVIANVSGCYVTNPIIFFHKRPIEETFFMVLRKIERLLL